MRDNNSTIAFIGPDGQCAAEALVAAAWNLPMITHVMTTNAPSCILSLFFFFNDSLLYIQHSSQPTSSSSCFWSIFKSFAQPIWMDYEFICALHIIIQPDDFPLLIYIVPKRDRNREWRNGHKRCRLFTQRVGFVFAIIRELFLIAFVGSSCDYFSFVLFFFLLLFICLPPFSLSLFLLTFKNLLFAST